MPIEDRGGASVITHAVARAELTKLRDVDTDQRSFRSGLCRLGRLCGEELVHDRFGTEPVTVRTPLAETTGDRVRQGDEIVIVTVLRAAIPFVEGLLEAFPRSRQGVISASRNDESPRGEDGSFPVAIEYVNLPEIRRSDTVIVADPMLATGSTMASVLEEVLRGTPEGLDVLALAVVSAPPGIDRVTATFPEVDVVSVAIDDELDDDGFIVPGLGDAGDRAFGTD